MRFRMQPMSRGVELIGVVAAYHLRCALIFNNSTALRQLILTHTHVYKSSIIFRTKMPFSHMMLKKYNTGCGGT